MNFVRLPSGHVLNMDLVDELWTEESGDVKRYVSGSDDAYTLRGDDASALRAWMATLPRLKTEAQVAGIATLRDLRHVRGAIVHVDGRKVFVEREGPIVEWRHEGGKMLDGDEVRAILEGNFTSVEVP